MVIVDPMELKLLEKYREIRGKRMKPGDPAISREFSIPCQVDSDDTIYCSVSVRYGSHHPITSSAELSVERGKLPKTFRV